MKGEQLKSILLTLLVISSLLLTLANWNYQPNFEMTGNEGDLVDAQIELGRRLPKVELIKPIHLILHQKNQGESIGLADKEFEDEVFQGILDYSLYNFSSTHLSENWWKTRDSRVEVVFPTLLPTETIRDLFNVDQKTTIPSGMYNRIDVIIGDDSHHIIFRNDQEERVIMASIQNYSRLVNRLESQFTRSEHISYATIKNSRGEDIYIPTEINKDVLLFSYTDIPFYPFNNFLFPTPSVVRSARSIDGNTIFIDGTRELILESDRVAFTNQTNEDKVIDEEITNYELFDQVQTFLNTHNGFTFEEPFGYFLSNLEQTPQSNEVVFSLSHGGYPIFVDRNIANITILWHNNEVYKYSHPLVTLVEELGISRQSTNVPTPDQVLSTLNSEYYRRTSIYDVVIGYRVREQIGGQGQVYELIPTWYVKSVNGWNPLVVSSEGSGGDISAMGPN